jgi:large subunit ribosomal protein L10
VDRTEKQEVVTAFRQMFQDAVSVVVTHYSGMTVTEMTDLRGRMRQAGASYKVTKNRLTRLALEDTSFKGLADMFTGPTGVAFSADPVAAAKVAVNYAKTNEKLVILGGAYNGQVLDVKGIKTLAELPSLDELRAQLLSMLQTPATRIASILQAPAGQVARVIGAYGAKEAA